MDGLINHEDSENGDGQPNMGGGWLFFPQAAILVLNTTGGGLNIEEGLWRNG